MPAICASSSTSVAVIGMLGKDRSGQQLRELLTAQNIDTSNAIEDESFSTIVKTRIIARHQQVVRVDREKIVSPSPEQIAKVVAAVRNDYPENRRNYFRRLWQRLSND